jgi:hypothetical protein
LEALSDDDIKNIARILAEYFIERIEGSARQKKPSNIGSNENKISTAA